MLLYGHDLDAVVSQPGNAGQHREAEFLVGGHLLLLARHADVAFVDEQGVALRHEVGIAEAIGFVRVPHLRAEQLGLVVLHHPPCPGRDALAAASVPLHQQLEELPVLHGIDGQLDFPVAVVNPLQSILLPLLPPVEIAYQVDGGGVGRPFAEHPSPRRLMQPEIQITRGEVRQRLRAPGQLLLHVTGIFIPAPNSLRIGAQIRV